MTHPTSSPSASTPIAARTVRRYACDRCGGSGKTRYTHIEAGRCFKCGGRGTLPYDPGLHGNDYDTAPEPDYDAYVTEQERRFWDNYDAEQDAADRQRFWEENGFEAS